MKNEYINKNKLNNDKHLEEEDVLKEKDNKEKKKMIIILSSVIALVVVFGLFALVMISIKRTYKDIGQNNNLKNQDIANQTQVEKKDSYDNSFSSDEVIVYKKDNQIISYNPAENQKTVIFESDKLVDFDYSDDGNFLAYTLREEGFEGNSDIFLKNLVSGEVVRLTEKNDIASLNPKILPDNSKVLYVRRKNILSNNIQKISDGEIWVINADGNAATSKKLIGNDNKPLITEDDLESVKILNKEGNWAGDYHCINSDEIDSVKIGISKIDPTGKVIYYWQAHWNTECSGLGRVDRFASIDGSNFFSEKFNGQNIFSYYNDGTDYKIENAQWDVSDLFLLENGGFIVDNEVMMRPFDSLISYDNMQNKKWVVYNDLIANEWKKNHNLLIWDIKEENDKLRIFYGTNGFNFFIKEIDYGQEMSITDFVNEKSLENLEPIDPFSYVKILDNDNFIYEKRRRKSIGEGKYEKKESLYIYDLANQKSKLIDESTEILLDDDIGRN